MTEWQHFQQMTVKQKCVHLWTYYKFHFLVILAVLIILGDFGIRAAAKKDPVLYVGELNFSPAEPLQTTLTQGYLEALGADPNRQEVVVYNGISLFAAPNAEQTDLANASIMKLMTIVNSGMLDVVLMNREAYDFCSQNGYLADLSAVADSALIPLLTENTVLIPDENGENPVSRQVCNGLNASAFPIFRDSPGETYLGLIFNSSRADTALDYMAYLCSKN